MTNSLKDLFWKLKMLRKEPVLLLFIVLLIVLLSLFVIYPLFMILRYSVTTDEGRVSLTPSGPYWATNHTGLLFQTA